MLVFAAPDYFADLHLVEVCCSVGLVVYCAHALNETTQQEHAELIEKQRLATEGERAKTEFLFNMSHDIRTPMNAIMGYTAMTRKNLDHPEIALGCLNKVDIAGKNLLQLIDQVLEMSCIEAGKAELEEEPASILEYSRSMITTVRGDAEEHGVHLKTDFGVIRDDDVLTDINRMNQIMLNILGNAIKFTPSDGTVTFRVRQMDSTLAGFGLYRFITEDTGIGMSKEFRDRIFDVFSRERTSTVSGLKGSGLGMAIVKKQVELMNGTVEVESEQGKSTVVTVTVPLKLKSANALIDEMDLPDPERKETLAGRRALVVEDNEMNREITRDILEDEGILVEIAEDGDIAVDMVGRSWPGYYDFVLMDVQMPRMNGYDATRAIRNLGNKQLASILIIATTANTLEEDRENAMKAGMNEHLGKPIDITKLMEILKKYLC